MSQENDETVVVEAGTSTGLPTEATSASKAVPTRSIGSSLGRYVVLGVLGAGGMGVVYRVYDPKLDRQIALKVLKAPKQGMDRAREAQDLALREAKTLAKLAHPNVVPVHDVGTYDGDVFVAMEHVDGVSLRAWGRERHAWREVVDVFIEAGRGLAAAHDAGIVHRDFKPSNVIVGNDGRVRVVDFGVARADTRPQSSAGTSRLQARDLERHDTLSRGGMVIGTPPYMAPEQHRGEPCDVRSDQYAFCVSMYQLLWSKLPFEADSVEELAKRKLGPPAEPSGDRGVPLWIKRIVWRGLSPGPEDRFASMHALLAALTDDPRVRRRRRAVGGFVVVLAAAAVVGPLWAGRQADPMCRGGSQRTAAVWGPQRQATIEAAFADLGKPYALEAWSGARAVIDRWVDDWVEMHREACEATHVRGVQSGELLDQRMLCLDRRLEELDALAAVFEHADHEVAERAVDAAHALAPLRPCADTKALTSRVERPTDPGVREELDRISRALAEVKARNDAGKPTEALELGQKLAEEAGTVGYRPLEAKALLRLGVLQAATGDTKVAQETLLRAAAAAKAGRDELLEANAWIGMVRVAGHMHGQAGQARTWADLGRATLEAAGGDPVLEADLDDALATAIGYVDNELEEAAKLHERALAIRREHLGSDHPAVAESLEHLGFVNLLRQRHDEAERALREALELRRTVFGEQHPAVAQSHRNLGRAYDAAEQFEKAAAEHRRALELFEAAFGRNHPSVARAMMTVGGYALLEERRDEALALRTEALEILEGLHGADHPSVATAVYQVGAVYDDMEQWSQALPRYERALKLRSSTLGVNHPFTVMVREDLAHVLEELGRTDDALQQREQLLEAVKAAEGPTSRESRVALTELGRARTRLGQPRQGVAALQEALAIVEGDEEQRSAIPVVRLALAEAHWATGAHRDAVEAAKKARAEADPSQTELVTSIERWLAEHSQGQQ